MNDWVEINKSWSEFQGRPALGYPAHELCRSGVLVRIQSSGYILEELIGDINESYGTCGCCSGSLDDIVLAAKVVYEK